MAKRRYSHHRCLWKY